MDPVKLDRFVCLKDMTNRHQYLGHSNTDDYGIQHHQEIEAIADDLYLLWKMFGYTNESSMLAISCIDRRASIRVK